MGLGVAPALYGVAAFFQPCPGSNKHRFRLKKIKCRISAVAPSRLKIALLDPYKL
jgi:hypothetical protein